MYEYGTSQADIFAASAGTHFDASRIKLGQVLLDDIQDQIGEFLMSLTHHLDRKVAGEFDQGFLIAGYIIMWLVCPIVYLVGLITWFLKA